MPIQGLFTESRNRVGRAFLSRPVDLGSLKEGSYIIIDGEPCKVVEVEVWVVLGRSKIMRIKGTG